MPFWLALQHTLACMQVSCLLLCPCKPALQGPGSSRDGWQHGTAVKSGSMVWGTTPALWGRPASTADGHKQAFLPKAVPAVCCLSHFLHCPLPATYTHNSVGSGCNMDHFPLRATAGAESDPRLSPYRDTGARGRKAWPGRGKGQRCYFLADE